MARRRQNGFSQRNISQAIRTFQKLDRRAQLVVLVLLAVVLIIAFVVASLRRDNASAKKPGPDAATQSQPASTAVVLDFGNSLLLGNPSSASPDPAQRDNLLLVHPEFTLSYNDSTKSPNWVSWRTVNSNFGDGERARSFKHDTLLPPGFVRVSHDDYKGSGFDRGHMCPRSDRDATQESAAATFITTNIVPQAPNNNQKAWNQLEIYARDLVRKQNCRLYTVCGPVGKRGRGLSPDRSHLGEWVESIGRETRINVPAATWKVIVAIPEFAGPDDPTRITADARVIAVIVPNDESVVGDPWAGYRVTPAEVERQTGYHFFTALSPDVADALRNKLDTAYIEPPQPHQYPKPGHNPSE